VGRERATPPPTDDEGVPRLTFVVPAWNEEELLPRTLRSIHRAARGAGVRYEIVVADGASTDRTPELARGAGARGVALERRQIAATRNAGARAARGAWLAFVDADTEVTEGAVRGAVEALEAGAVYGGAAVTCDGRTPLWSRVLLPALLFGYARLGVASGAFLFTTRADFEAVGGFDESLYAAEEAVLSRALARRGPFAWVRAPVVTSGRKLRAYSTRELLVRCARLVLRGRSGVRRREALDLWYGPRRSDPGDPQHDRSGGAPRP